MNSGRGCTEGRGTVREGYVFCILWGAAVLGAGSWQGGAHSPTLAMGDPPAPCHLFRTACTRCPACLVSRSEVWGCWGAQLCSGAELKGGHAPIALLCAVGGLLVGFPEDIPESLILHGAELQYYIERFQRSGFR